MVPRAKERGTHDAEREAANGGAVILQNDFDCAPVPFQQNARQIYGDAG